MKPASDEILDSAHYVGREVIDQQYSIVHLLSQLNGGNEALYTPILCGEPTLT